MATKPPPTPPEVDPAYSALTLDDLRDLRRELGDEESRVSYWRRIIQARIDLLTKGSPDGDIVERLTSVLAESGSVHRRLARLSVKPAGDIEALPDLHGLWTRVVDSRDTEAVAEFVEELHVVETRHVRYPPRDPSATRRGDGSVDRALPAGSDARTHRAARHRAPLGHYCVTPAGA